MRKPLLEDGCETKEVKETQFFFRYTSQIHGTKVPEQKSLHSVTLLLYSSRGMLRDLSHDDFKAKQKRTKHSIQIMTNSNTVPTAGTSSNSPLQADLSCRVSLRGSYYTTHVLNYVTKYQDLPCNQAWAQASPLLAAETCSGFTSPSGCGCWLHWHPILA